MYNAEIIPEHVYLLFFTMKVTFENKGPVFKRTWSLPVGRKDTQHIWVQQNHPCRKGPRSHEASRHLHTTKEGGGGGERGALHEQPPQGARAFSVGLGAASRLPSHPQSASRSRPRPLQGSARLASGLQATGKWSAVAARFQKSEPSSPKRQLFYTDFVEPTSRALHACFIYFFFFFPLYLLLLLFLTADPLKAKTTKKHHLGRQRRRRQI